MRKYITAVLLTLGAGLFMASCEKKDVPVDDPQTEKESELSEQSIFWGVVGQLVSQRNITPDYKGKTFPPSIGTPDGGDESVRVESVGSLREAVDGFNTLTDAGITETTASYTWQNAAVGSLTWNLGDGTTAFATVDVNIPSVPSLSKIIYRSPEQGDVNGSVGDHGSAYYRFGDVLKTVREDGVVEYWICVRPAFGPENKGDAHFVSVSKLPKEKIWPYNSTKESQHNKPWKASNDFLYGFPEDIGKETKWSENLAEMLYAIVNPTAWYTNAWNYTSTRIFTSFERKNLKYHNEYFWKKVQEQWKEKDLVPKIFGISYQQLEELLSPVSDGSDPNLGSGLHFLYYTFSWSTSYSNSPKLYEIHYTHGSAKDEKNMHKITKRTVSHQVVVPRAVEDLGDNNFPFDFWTETSAEQPYVIKNAFFGDRYPRWTIRYMTGEDLSVTGAFDNQQPIPGFHDTNEVYRYYRDVFPEKSLMDAPEITEDDIVNSRGTQMLTDFKGRAHYRHGDVLRDQHGHLWFVLKPSGNVVDEAHPDGWLPEHSPYTELISFDGIQYSADGRTATNIATRDQALRYMNLIWLYAQEANKRVITENNLDIVTGHSILRSYVNIRDHAHVRLKDLAYELIVPKYHLDNETGAGETWSMAYYVPGSADQHLMRCVTMMDQNSNFKNIMYDVYPSVSTNEGRECDVYWDLGPGSFSNTPIYLQDVTNQDKVTQYGPDRIALARFFNTPSVPRVPYRTAPDARAASAQNYAYNMNAWANADTKPLGMWNDPVLLFRATALYDRGNKYATISTDGLQLTMVSRGGYLMPGHEEDEVPLEGEPTEQDQWLYAIQWVYQAFCYNRQEDRKLNGVSNAMPTWQQVWGDAQY